jgi:exosortase
MRTAMSFRLNTRNGWTVWHVVAALALVATSVAITWMAWSDMWQIAMKDEESSHVLLVPVAVGWLVWVRRARFRQCRPQRSLLGAVLIGVGWLLWSVGYKYDVQSFWHGGAVLMAVGCFVTVVGRDILFRFLPAFLVLVFLIPVPGRARQSIAIPMQRATASATQGVLETMGVPVERQENLLSINGKAVTIAEACNGMRMVFTLILVSYIFAFTTPLRGYVRALILVASPLTAILCNVIRLIPTVWGMGHVSEETGHAFHDAAGWVMLVVAFLMLMSIEKVLKWAMVPVREYTLAST